MAGLSAIATAAAVWELVFRDGPVPKALGKLGETVAEQIGLAGRALNDRLRAKVEAANRKLETENAIEIEAMKAEATQQAKLRDLRHQDERAAARLEIQERRRQRNIEQVVAQAAEELQNAPDSEVSDQQVDPDWTTQFFIHAQDVSNEDMQKIWAKLLAGEVKRPGSFSLRTLNAVKAMSQQEGEIFARLCSVIWYDVDGEKLWALTDAKWVHAEDSPLSFNYTDCLRMQECGLVDVASTHCTIWMPASGFFLSYYGSGFFFQKGSSAKPRFQLDAGTFHWTTTGEELARIASGMRSQLYLEAVLVHYRKQGLTIRPARLVGSNEVQVELDG
jgi:hypothetical protein